MFRRINNKGAAPTSGTGVSLFNKRGFTVVELIVAISILAIFAVGIYSSLQLIYKVVYLAKIKVLETSILSEELEIARNLPFSDVGIAGAFDVPGVLLPTKHLTRNGLDFMVINTVRFIDDPFDYTITGTPPNRDIAPADYKLVEMAIYCPGINQATPLILSTIIGPNKQEDANGRGALFIEAIDSLGRPVPQASVHVEVINSSTYKDDVTDNNGHLYIMNVPTGTMLYYISVTKDGFTTESTVSSTILNPSPVKPLVTVMDNTAAELSFAIDTFSNLHINTVNSVCSNVGFANLQTYGEKLIGLPSLLKFDLVGQTNSSGLLDYDNIEWDKYYSVPTGTSYSLVGTIPMLPLKLNAGETQNLTLILRSRVTNSLLVKVKDNITGMPISDATVYLYVTSTGYSQTYQTGLGYGRQTDWSGGLGQEFFTDETKYYSDDNKLDVSTEGKIKLKQIGGEYYEEGCMMSSVFDTGEAVDFRNIALEPFEQPSEVGTTSLKIQVATSNTSTPADWNFLGPDGTVDSWYTNTSTVINSIHNNQQYFRYKLCLSTASTTFSPEVSDFFFTYVNGCTSPGQVYFSSLTSGEYTLEVEKIGYQSITTTVDVAGNNEVEVNMIPL